MIYSYFWTQSKWYGGNWHGEPVFEGIDITEFEEGETIIDQDIIDSDSVRYIFEVKEKALTYLGTWHFDVPNAFFTNDKDSFDIEIKSEYKKLDFEKAEVSIPE